MPTTDPTHDSQRRSFLESANDAAAHFPIQNLPFGVFRRHGGAGNNPPRIGVAIGDRILDLPRSMELKLLEGLKADVADTRRRNQLQHRVEHAQPRAQDGHDDDVGRDAAAVRRPQRRLDRRRGRRQIARRLGGQQQADAHRHAAEHFRRRLRVAQRQQGIMHERVLDDVDRHGATISGRV